MKESKYQSEYQAKLGAKMSKGDPIIGKCPCGKYFTARVWNTSTVNRVCNDYSLCRGCRRGKKVD